MSTREKAIKYVMDAMYEATWEAKPATATPAWSMGYGGESGLAAVAIDAFLRFMKEHEDEFPATISQSAWMCEHCGTDHGEEGCGEPLTILWNAYRIEDIQEVLSNALSK